MSIIIYGRACTGKTTLMEKILYDNPDKYATICDDYVQSDVININRRFLLVVQDLRDVSESLQSCATLLNIEHYRR